MSDFQLWYYRDSCQEVDDRWKKNAHIRLTALVCGAVHATHRAQSQGTITCKNSVQFMTPVSGGLAHELSTWDRDDFFLPQLLPTL